MFCLDYLFCCACTFLNMKTEIRKLQKQKSTWYYICCLRKGIPYCSVAILLSCHTAKCLCMEIQHFLQMLDLSWEQVFGNLVNNNYYTPSDLNNAINEERTTKQNPYWHLNISSLSNHQSDMNAAPKTI